MRRWLLVALLLCPACAPTSLQTPQGKVAYTADQIVLRVNELENAAIQANTNKALPDNTTVTIVRFCVAADQILKATPVGWQASVQAAWATAKLSIPSSNPAIAAAVSAVDVALATLGGS